jgi:lysophospholipid acyltransferase (LPLAT)-like uncharacterized protein
MPATVVKSSKVVKVRKIAWHGRLLAFLIYSLVRLVTFTIRFKWNDQGGLFSTGVDRPVIYCTWHNCLALCLPVQRYVGLRRCKDKSKFRRMAAIVSASRDGGLLARILELFDVQPVRGSSSRRGPQALLELTSWAERGLNLAITPDGPRGPCYHVQDGVIALAQITGLPIYPMVYHLNWKIRIKSWDRFQIPLPFARCTVNLGQAVRVPREADDAERERLRLRLEQQMQSFSQE